MRLSTFLRTVRDEKAQSQVEAAAALSCTEMTYRSWELGRSVPDLSRVEDFVRYLGISTSEVLELLLQEQLEHKKESVRRAEESLVLSRRIRRKGRSTKPRANKGYYSHSPGDQRVRVASGVG